MKFHFTSEPTLRFHLCDATSHNSTGLLVAYYLNKQAGDPLRLGQSEKIFFVVVVLLGGQKGGKAAKLTLSFQFCLALGAVKRICLWRLFFGGGAKSIKSSCIFSRAVVEPHTHHTSAHAVCVFHPPCGLSCQKCASAERMMRTNRNIVGVIKIQCSLANQFFSSINIVNCCVWKLYFFSFLRFLVN